MCPRTQWCPVSVVDVTLDFDWKGATVRTLAFATLLLLPFQTVVLGSGAPAEDDHVLSKDKTGIRWVYPFSKAQKQSAATQRLLLIKPVAFGTDRQGGW